MADQLDMAHEDLLQAIDGLDPEQIVMPFPGRDWSIKDTLAHIASNESLMTEVLQSIANGATTCLQPDFDNDRFNAEQVALSKGKSIDQLEGELEASRQKLFKVLEALRAEQVQKIGLHPLQGRVSVKEFLVVMYAHTVSHLREIREQVWRLRRMSEVV